MPQLELSDGVVEVSVARSRRRTIGVSVRDDGSVVARAPRHASKADIREVLEGFRAWIETRRAEVLELRQRRESRRFEDGEAIPYLGGELTLRVLPTLEARVRPPERTGRTLAIRVPTSFASAAPDARREAVRREVMLWLLGRAGDVFHERHLLAAERVGYAAERIRIKDMSTRWGSCGPNRRMSLNWRLILAPVAVIDYVLVHELVHVRIQDHSRRFWRAVEEALPGYGTSASWLRKHGDGLEL